MTKQQKSIGKEMTLSGVPTVRRHAYFYIVLFLGTTLLHQAVWKPSLSDAPSDTAKVTQEIAQVQHELVLAGQRFAP